MSWDRWTRWPSKEALAWESMSLARLWFVGVLRAIILGILLWNALHGNRGWHLVAGIAVVLGVSWAGWAFFRVSFAHRLWPSLALMTLLLGAGLVADLGGWGVLALVLWFGSPSPRWSGCRWPQVHPVSWWRWPGTRRPTRTARSPPD